MTIRRRDDHHLAVTGAVGEPRRFEVDDLAALPGTTDKRFGSTQGPAIAMAALLDAIDIAQEADHATVSSGDGHYRASIPLDQLRRGGWLFVGVERGGPLRLIVEDGRTLCWNVKDVVGIRLTVGPEPDSVPENPPH